MGAEPAFDEAIHAPNRLRLCGLLRPVEEAEFSALRSTLEMSEANLSKTVKALVDLGYAQVKKESSSARADRRRTTTVSLTSRGRRAFDGHVAALQQLAAGVVV